MRITGWVHNASDGSVEVWAEGSEEALASFLKWLKKGPPFAYVKGVVVKDEIPSGKYANFSYER